ncbi:hypothetical protein E2542_SST10433 [Spatholobus suberectus]|nr:hypothetical protein E2542_SST10433 [Spatholobus suberectus]
MPSPLLRPSLTVPPRHLCRCWRFASADANEACSSLVASTCSDPTTVSKGSNEPFLFLFFILFSCIEAQSYWWVFHGHGWSRSGYNVARVWCFPWFMVMGFD